jgi:broad specificity phosphatase PhoE
VKEVTVWTSQLRRTKQTAAPLASSTNVRCRPAHACWRLTAVRTARGASSLHAPAERDRRRLVQQHDVRGDRGGAAGRGALCALCCPAQDAGSVCPNDPACTVGALFPNTARRRRQFEARQSDKLRYRYPQGGESYTDVIERLKPMIIESATRARMRQPP